MVIWRPGFTIWVSALNNDKNESKEDRLARLRKDVSPDALDVEDVSEEGVLRLRYRLNEESEDRRVAAFYGFVVGVNGHIQLGIYFDDEGDLERGQADLAQREGSRRRTALAFTEEEPCPKEKQSRRRRSSPSSWSATKCESNTASETPTTPTCPSVGGPDDHRSPRADTYTIRWSKRHSTPSTPSLRTRCEMDGTDLEEYGLGDDDLEPRYGGPAPTSSNRPRS